MLLRNTCSEGVFSLFTSYHSIDWLDFLGDLSLKTHLGKSGDEEGKQKVAKIHELKEKLKQENEVLKKIKQNLKDVQDKQKVEKEVYIIANMFFI